MRNSVSPAAIIQKYTIPFIVLFTFIIWSPVLLVQFLNDDYQILGYHAGKSLINIFQPFWTPDISGVYWRPVGNLIHPLIMYIAGFDPIPFRIVSLLSYILCCVVFYLASERLGLSKKTAIWITLLFAALPSHEFQVAWIADTGESLVTASLLLSFIFYENIYRTDKTPARSALLAMLFFLIALLIKEVAFSGVLIPFFALFLHGDFKKYNLKRAVRDYLIGLFILAAVLLYRYFVIGGTPFGSAHFEHSGPVKWISHFFIYLLLSVFPPETIESVFYYTGSILMKALTVILAGFVFYGFIKAVINMSPRLRKILSAGLIWFVIFVLPALPTLMRWYVFTASAGIMWMLAAIIEYLNTIKSRVIFITVMLILITGLSVYDFNLMLRWKDVSYHFSRAYTSLQILSPEKEMTIWGVPDKVNRIPMMKLGIAETVQSAMEDSSVNIYAPLRMELTGFLSSMKLDSLSGSMMRFRLRGGRFLVERGTSRAVIITEQIEQEYDGYRFVINNSELESTALVYFDSLKGMQYFYDGNRVRKIAEFEQAEGF